ncbi:MAG: hypothetical protein ACYS1A_20210 [Planctomycetota bacterium]
MEAAGALVHGAKKHYYEVKDRAEAAEKKARENGLDAQEYLHHLKEAQAENAKLKKYHDEWVSNARAAETRADEEHESANEAHGLLANVCDALYGDEERALNHGYEGVVEKAKELQASVYRRLKHFEMVGRLLEPIREKRHTGEPARSDREELEALITRTIKAEAVIKGVREWAEAQTSTDAEKLSRFMKKNFNIDMSPQVIDASEDGFQLAQNIVLTILDRIPTQTKANQCTKQD